MIRDRQTDGRPGINNMSPNPEGGRHNYDGLESPLLHTKFRENRSTGSGDFEGFLSYMGVATILVM